MNWRRAHIDLQRIDSSLVEQALLKLGAVSVDLSDAANDPILEPAPGATPLWPTLHVSALFHESIDDTAVRLAVAGAIVDDKIPAMRFEPVADQDWIENWRQTLQPMRFGRNLWVCPRGSACPDSSGAVIELDPGLAFGTGSHPTTALCLDWLAHHVGGDDSVLDYGCGSGILSVAAAVLGATRVLSVDLDRQARRATRQNANHNHVAERLDVVGPEAAGRDQNFDLIVANILSGTLIELASELRRFSHTGTRIALSGILTDQSESVMAAYRPWVAFEPPITRDNWVLLAGTVSAI